MQSKRKNVDKRKIFLWCAAAGIVLCAVLFCLWHNRTALAEQRVERALSVTVSQPEPRLAQEDNTETGAWITVPGTNIDAPVQQASDNDYYLRRDTAGNADVHGCVFADYACDLNSTSLSRNLVLYGHTFEDGYEGGFKALHNYEQDSFAEEHPYIYLSLPDAALTYRVVSAGVCSAADDRDCIEPNPDDAAFAQILAKGSRAQYAGQRGNAEPDRPHSDPLHLHRRIRHTLFGGSQTGGCGEKIKRKRVDKEANLLCAGGPP